MDSYDTFINSIFYNDTLRIIKEKTDIKIDPKYDKIDKKSDLKDISKSNLTIKNIKKFIEENYDEVIKFICEKIKYYRENGEDYEDFSKKENNEKNKNSVKVEYLGYMKSFIISYAVELYFLKNNPKKLSKYLIDINIYQTKYEEELKEIYNKINKNI
jgi:L-cysteine desulfidase